MASAADERLRRWSRQLPPYREGVLSSTSGRQVHAGAAGRRGGGAARRVARQHLPQLFERYWLCQGPEHVDVVCLRELLHGLQNARVLATDQHQAAAGADASEVEHELHAVHARP